ncbi:MAG TPA: hypothetical protein VFZ01_05290, partial [Geminicoccaceae bacterium]
MATDLERFGFREVGGTRGEDAFTSSSPNTVHLGGPGNDLFIASDALDAETGAHFFLGGGGSDQYQLDPETFTVIGNGGGRDVVLAPGLSFTGATVFEVDRQHLGVVDPETGAGVVILDWISDRIDSIEFSDGVRRIGIDINPVQLRFEPNVITDQSFAELSANGILPPGAALDDELIEALTARAEAFEDEAGDGLSIVGGEAGEVLSGGDGPDMLDGAGGDDRIDGLAGDDRLLGGDGDDLILAGDGADDVDGGRGDDQLSGDAGADVVRGGDGNDRLQGGGQGDRLDGGRGDDDLDGSGGSDTLLGGDGSDRIDGGGGDDSLVGGRGDDRLDGGGGDDRLRGGGDDDRLAGGSGNDELRGGGGDDVLDGGDGRDEVQGGQGNDDLTGGSVNDALR